jgi:signal transduction histidine kinase/CheY-like chemotaxis protein
MRSLLSVLFIIYLFGPVYPALSNDNWRIYTAEEGLVENWTSAVCAGKGDSMWIRHGSIDYMTHFDGFAFSFKPAPEFYLNLDHKMVCDSQDRLWTLAPNGLQVLENEIWRTIEIKEISNYDYSRFGRVSFQLAIVHSRFLVIRLPVGLLVFNTNDNTYKILKKPNDDGLGECIALTVLEDRVCLTMENGFAIGYYHPENGTVEWRIIEIPENINICNLNYPCMVSENHVFLQAASKDREEYHVYQIIDRDWKRIFSSPSQFIRAWSNNSEIVWFYDEKQLLHRLSIGETDTVKIEESLNVGSVMSYTLDERGNFWLASSHGVYHCSPSLWKESRIFPPSTEIYSMIETSDQTLFASGSNALYAWDGEQCKEYPFPDDVTLWISARSEKNVIHLFNDDIIVIRDDNTRGRLTLFNTQKREFRFFHHPRKRFFHTAFKVQKEGLHMVTLTDRYKYTAEKFWVEWFDGASIEPLYDFETLWELPDTITALEKRDDTIWISSLTEIGVIQNNSFRNLENNASDQSNGFFDILTLSSGQILFGGRSGLYRYGNGLFSRIPIQAKDVAAIIEDDQKNIWLAASNGVFTRKNNHWIHYDQTDGLGANYITNIVSNYYGIFAKAGTRLYRYRPEVDLRAPETYIPNELNTDESNQRGAFQIQFYGIDFQNHTSKERLTYSYQLDRKEWSPFSSETFAQFSSLPVGKHVFSVRAMDQNGNIDPTPAQWKFTTPPIPLQERWYFLPSMILITSILLLLSIMTVVSRKKIAAYANNLESLVSERTLELQKANRQLEDDIKAQKRLEEQLLQSQKMESVGRLAGGVAHDFNNMLGVILGRTEISLQKMEPTHDHYSNLTEIMKAAERSADLTRQLLAFARRQTAMPKVIHLNHTVEGMLKILRRLIGEDIELIWRPMEGLWPVKIDPAQVDQIMVNLCVNARDAISGVGQIIIETANIHADESYCEKRMTFQPGDYVQLAVSDTGCGMDKDTVARIFDPFYTTKRVGEGTGLGLSTVYGIVKQNKGFINVYSEPGQGTSFKIYLLHCKQEESVDNIEESPMVAARGDESILLVEDDSAHLNMTKTMLEELGYKTLAANSPQRAIEIAKNYTGDIHLLLTDVIMPNMNGRQLSSEIQKINANIIIVYMSGYTSNVIAHHGVLEEGVNYIQKPFTSRMLADKIRKALKC